MLTPTERLALVLASFVGIGAVCVAGTYTVTIGAAIQRIMGVLL